MTAIATASSSADAATAAKELATDLSDALNGAAPAIVFVFASTKQPLESLLPEITARFPDATVLSASTAGEFTERVVSKGAAVAVAIAGEFKAYAGIGTGLAAGAEAAVATATASLPSSLDGYPHRTAVMLVDPLSGNGEEATLMAATALGGDSPVRLAGGAAGDDLGMKTTHVGVGERVASDAVVIATLFSKAPLGIGVCHGHAPLTDPVTVTKAEGSTVHEIDGRPAWDVWKEQTRGAAAAAGIDIDTLAPEDVGAFLLRYEAGLASGTEYKIRAPLSRGEDGSLSFACGVPEGAVLRITESTPQRQVESAATAATRARAQLSGDAAGAVVFDCICRNLILSEKFDDAVSGISQALGGVPIAGFETYGEIALDVGDMSGFHNTTTVVLAFPA